MYLTELANALIRKRQTLATVESCTGGGIAAKCTDLAGSSEWFIGGVITYSNAMKIQLGVSQIDIESSGAVSRTVVEQMASKGLEYCQSDWCIAVSGVAGPGGGSMEKPVGTVWLAWAGPNLLRSESAFFSGDRVQVRQQTVDYSLVKLIELLK